MFYFIFVLFKIDIYPKEMIFASLIMSFISYVLRTVYELPQMDVIVQVLLMFCFIWLLFKIHVFYAAILTGMAYQAYMFIQGLYYFIMDSAGLFDVGLPYILSICTFVLQTLSAATAIGIGYFLSIKRKGFDFVPDKPSGKIAVKTWEKVLFALNIPSVIIVLLTMYFASNLSTLFFVVPLVNAIILYGYLYFAYKKDRAEDEHFSV
ncbi:hypothetical protein [Paenibacillus sp. J2TS4]|uniref:hypothetical protein n=1 Tax=Paenibacillus sp. J2TS4 TaxID=2807194 RepID=UPI001BCC7E2B|nr:hypothetical protein [Paenibacillus sp. J2TS4]